MSDLISNAYVEQNKSLHEVGDFGVSGYKWAASVGWLINNHKIRGVLDYGAGQQTLKNALRKKFDIEINCYDPAIPELAASPRSAELVTCTDVLEHIEPENLNNVLEHIQSLADKYVFFVIPTGPANKTLSDGRNAHLIQKPVDWWLPKLSEKFNLISINNMSSDIVFFGCKKSSVQDDVGVIFERLMLDYPKCRLMSMSFDGACCNISIKERNILNRILPRFLSLLKLGARVGVVERGSKRNRPPFFTVGRY